MCVFILSLVELVTGDTHSHQLTSLDLISPLILWTVILWIGHYTETATKSELISMAPGASQGLAGYSHSDELCFHWLWYAPPGK
jgi:hypothetical protein